MQYTKPINETIEKRYSCRTFSNKPLNEEIIEKIKRNLNPITGVFGSTIHFEFIDSEDIFRNSKSKIGTYGLVKNARYFIVGIMKKENTELQDFGYVFEKVILKMTELDLGTVWLGRSFNQDFLSTYLQIREDEYIPAISPVGIIAEKKSFIEKAITLGISSEKRQNWDKLFFENDFNTPLKKEEDYYSKPLEMIRIAPSARNQQPWRILKIENTFHFYIEIKPTLKQMSHFPFIDIGIAMSHFELSLNSQNLTGEWVKNEPKIASKPKNYSYAASFVVE